MNSFKSFVLLDFRTVKPYFTLKNLLVYAAVGVFLSTFSGSAQMSIGIGFMLGTLFISYPFAVGEKNNIDALYITLSISRGTVVRGRYLFVLAVNLLAVLGSYICASLALFASMAMGVFQTSTGGNEALPLILAMAAIMILIQAIQLPLYFKMGYDKAKFLSVVPFIALMGGFSAFMSVARDTPGKLAWLWGFIENAAKGRLAVPIILSVLAIAILVSYCLSLAFYKRREY